MDADVREALEQTNRNDWRVNDKPDVFGIDERHERQRRGAHRERHRMLPGVACLETQPVVFVMLGRAIVLVCGKRVMVLRVVVVGVVVGMKRDLAEGRGYGEANEDRNAPMHG